MQAGGRRFDPVWLHQPGIAYGAELLRQSNTYSSMKICLVARLRTRGLLSDIVKRGSCRSCEHEKSCARVHVFAALKPLQADILDFVKTQSCRTQVLKPSASRNIRQLSFNALEPSKALEFRASLSVRSREVKLVFLSFRFHASEAEDDQK